MNRSHQLRIASRVHALLQRELGQGIDVVRMSDEPLYARDVLLVCDALHVAEAAQLAEAFRKATIEPAEETAAPAAQAETSGFRPSRFLGSIFGVLTGPPSTLSDASTLRPAVPPPRRARRWFGGTRGP